MSGNVMLSKGLTLIAFASTFALQVFSQVSPKVLSPECMRLAPKKQSACFIEKGLKLESTNLNFALLYYFKALELARKCNDYEGQIDAYANITYVENQQGKFEKSIRHNAEALAISRTIKDKKRTAQCLFNLGSAYNNAGKFGQSLHCYLEAKKYYSRYGKRLDLVTVNTNIGGVFSNIGNYKKADHYFVAANRDAQILQDDIELAKTHIDLGLNLQLLEKHSQAVKHLDTGIIFAQKTANTVLAVLAKGHRFESLVYLKKHPLNEALKQLQRLTEESDRIGSWYVHLQILSIRARLLFKANKFPEAAIMARSALELAESKHYLTECYGLYDIAAKSEKANQHYTEAYALLERGKFVTDSINQLKLQGQLSLMEMDYRKARQREKIQQLELDKQQQNTLIYLIIIAVLVVLIVFSLRMMRLQKQRNRLKELAAMQELEKTQLEQQANKIAAESMLQGQEQERRRLSEEIHDGLGGLLSGIKLAVIQQENSLPNTAFVQESLDTAITEMRNIAYNLSPQAVSRYGLATAIADFCQHFNQQKQWVYFQHFGEKRRLTELQEISLFRICQECINNAVKHSEAEQITVQVLQNEAQTTIIISDNGRGISNPDHHGQGLTNINYRAQLIGANLILESEPDIGTSITLIFESNGTD